MHLLAAINAVPASRSTDPQPSRDAERRVTQAGTRLKQAEQFLRFLEAHRGREYTSAEIACQICVTEGAGESSFALMRIAAARRLPELRRIGRIQNGVTRECRVNRGSATTWIVP